LRSLKKLYGVTFFNLLNLFLKVLLVVALTTWLRSQFQRPTTRWLKKFHLSSKRLHFVVSL